MRRLQLWDKNYHFYYISLRFVLGNKSLRMANVVLQRQHHHHH